MNTNLSSAIALWANRAVALVLAVLLFAMPALLEWYARLRQLPEAERVAISAAFYCCAVIIAPALWNLDRLLCRIRRGEVFTRENARSVRRIQWCCGGVGAVCLPAGLCYLPLIFLSIIMSFLCLVVSVVACMMDAAAAIREENDLTI